MRNQPSLIDAVAIADRITVTVTRVECDSCGSCYTTAPKASIKPDGERWLHRHARSYMHLSLLEALDAAVCWLAFIASDMELQAAMTNQLRLPVDVSPLA